jgi:hypothetical protein
MMRLGPQHCVGFRIHKGIGLRSAFLRKMKIICALNQATAVQRGAPIAILSARHSESKRQPHGLQNGLCVIPFCNALRHLSSPDEALMYSRGTGLLTMCNDN